MPSQRSRRSAVATMLVGALLLALVPALSATADPDPAATSAQGERAAAGPVGDPWPDTADGLVIRPARGASAEVASDAVAGLARAEAAVGRPVGGGFHRIDLDEEVAIEELEAIAAQLVRDGVAESAEPDYRAVPMVVPDDPFYDEQWHLHGRDLGGEPVYGIDVEAAWARSVGSSDVVVAVLDTGSLPHPDIADRLVAGYNMISDPATARNAEGRGTDATDNGDWRLAGDCSAPNHGARASTWHGLHVAGTIGASTDNAIGVAGVDQAARIQHVRVLGLCGGTSADIAAAIRWAAGGSVAGAPANATPAKVINLSLGGGAACPSGVQSAVTAAVGLGATVVAAAGNDPTSIAPYPANCDGVISVASTTPVGDRAGYSNHGDWVDIAAPGGDSFFGVAGLVLSTHNGGTQAANQNWTYAFMQGTSMATPHVSGVVSLMLSVHPGLSPSEVRDILTATARPFPQAGFGYDCSSDPGAPHRCGAGIVDAGAAVAGAAAAAASVFPPALSGSAGPDRQVALEWEPHAGVAGPATYRLHRHSGGGASCATTGTPIAVTDSTSFTDTNRIHGQTYRYCVTATQDDETSIRSNIVEVTANDATAPAAPTIGASNGDRSVTLDWSLVSDPTTPVTHRLYRGTGSCTATGSPIHTTTSGTSHTNTGLTHGTSYRYCMTATDGAGNISALSNVQVITAQDLTAPAAPVLAATPGQGNVKLTWNAVSDPTPPVTYEVHRSTGSSCSTADASIHSGSATSFTDAGVTDGATYRYCLTATDGAGNTSALSNTRTVTVTMADTTAPAAPTIGASNGNLRVTLSWNAVSDPSPPVTYRLYRRTGSSCSASGSPIRTTTSGTSYTDTGLKHGTTYRYCMTATDAAGNVSDLSNTRSVTARDTSPPSAPSLTAKAGLDQVALSWGAVSDPTGPITYRLHRSTGSGCSTSSPRIHQGTGRSFTDTSVTGGRTYRYCVTATDGAGNTSARSTVRTVTPKACHALVGDWDGSGRDGLGWWCDGDTRLRTSSGRIHEFRYGRAGDVPVVADWNGDGRDTVSVIRNGSWHVNNSLRGGPAERTFIYGRVSLGDVPIAGAWDRGRRDLPGIVRDRTWHLRGSQSGGSSTWQFVYGRLTAGDLPLWGDWNADGRDTAGIVRQGTWHLRNSHAGGVSDISYTYGRVLAGDRPVVGDWTGDGRDTPGIVRNGQWHLRYVHRGGGADRTISFAAP